MPKKCNKIARWLLEQVSKESEEIRFHEFSIVDLLLYQLSNHPWTSVPHRLAMSFPESLLNCQREVSVIKKNQIFLIYKEIQNGAVAKSYMRIEEGLPNI
jgi:hypothetical protein